MTGLTSTLFSMTDQIRPDQNTNSADCVSMNTDNFVTLLNNQPSRALQGSKSYPSNVSSTTAISTFTVIPLQQQVNRLNHIFQLFPHICPSYLDSTFTTATQQQQSLSLLQNPSCPQKRQSQNYRESFIS
eukprot:TRINITY_DN30861_c0_g2_i1.p1 TRINITY_DN30861_c0_g2~~TRINITY_DN30861_c0_g2_i1.p1  ORF type:complete len:130 (+),score=14.68 TRINITY_DN30861_c0_g2_i1:372-761(+)